MTLEQAYFITQIVVGIGFIISIVFWRCSCGKTLSCFVIQWLSLQWNLKLAASRPNFASAYELCKDGYPKKVQEFWESLPKMTENPLADVVS